MANSLDLVLLIPDLEYMGGAERVVLKIAGKHSAPIYCLRYKPEKTYPQFREFEVRLLKPSILNAPARAISAIDRDGRIARVAESTVNMMRAKITEDYDAISAHIASTEFIRARNERVNWYCHGWTPSFPLQKIMLDERNLAEKAALIAGLAAYRGLEATVMPNVETVSACSRYVAGKMERYMGRSDASVAYPAVEPESFLCSGYGKYFLHVSRLAPEKNMRGTIMAFRRFSATRKGWKLVLAGSLALNMRNRKYMEELRRLSAGLDIKFVVDPDDKTVRKLYAGCRAFLFSSFEEDWGIVVLEAMASSKPCISVDIGGPRESVVDGKTGFLVNSAEEMAEKMRFLADHPSVCEKMGKEGRKLVLQNYTWKIFLEKMEHAFRETARM